MSAVVADTSVWIELLAGRPVPALVEALRQGLVVLPPIVVAELISGARRARDRTSIQSLVEELPLHETPLEHWVRVGDLRRRLAGRGVSVSTPDAHVAQCALERGAVDSSGPVETRSATDAQDPAQWVVDGQQRTTALCILSGRKP